MHPFAEPDFARFLALVEAGRPLSELVPLFHHRPDAFQWYAKAMTTRFGHCSTTDCAVCGHPDATRQEAYEWEATVNTRRTLLWSFLVSVFTVPLRIIYTRAYRIGFVTRHRFCADCAQSIRYKRWLSCVAQHVFFALLIASLLAAVPLTVFDVSMLFMAPDIVPRLTLFWLGALLPLSLSVAGIEWCRRLAIPAALRHIGRFPFVLLNVETEFSPTGN